MIIFWKIHCNLDTPKASQESDKKNSKGKLWILCAVFLWKYNYICHSILPSNLKSLDVTTVYKKNSKNSNQNYRNSNQNYQMFPKYTNDVYMIICRTILKIYSQNINVAFAKATMPNTVL